MKPPPASSLPAIVRQRAEPLPETVRYTARPGLGALPEGGGAMLGFACLQTVPIVTFLWAVWWPWPTTPATMAFASLVTAAIALLSAFVFWMLFGRRPRQVRGLALAPFIRLTVTDRRVLWTLPWRRAPLFEIGARRVRGGLLGETNPRGSGAAALMLWPGDPAGDDHGLVHFDRLPQVGDFVDALAMLV